MARPKKRPHTVQLSGEEILTICQALNRQVTDLDDMIIKRRPNASTKEAWLEMQSELRDLQMRLLKACKQRRAAS